MSEIEDKLRAMLKRRIKSDAAYLGVARRIARENAALDRGLIRKQRKAEAKAQWAPKPVAPLTPKVELAAVGRISHDGAGGRWSRDRFGRVWIITRSAHGWHAEGPHDVREDHDLVPTLNRATSAEIRAKIKTIGRDLKPYHRIVPH